MSSKLRNYGEWGRKHRRYQCFFFRSPRGFALWSCGESLCTLPRIDRSDQAVQHILGHTQVKTTQRYAHLSQDTLLAASNAATLAVGSVMGAMPNRVLDVPLVAT